MFTDDDVRAIAHVRSLLQVLADEAQPIARIVAVVQQHPQYFDCRPGHSCIEAAARKLEAMIPPPQPGQPSPSLSREANNAARKIVQLIEVWTGAELHLGVCMRIVELVQLAIDSSKSDEGRQA